MVALTYQEITFIFNHLELAERFNFKDYESAGSLEEPIKPEEETWFLTKLYKMQWTERIQRMDELSSIPKNFYSWAKKHIRKLKEESKIHLEKMREYEYALNLYRDIVSVRARKIISLATLRKTSSDIKVNLDRMTPEEKELYNKVRMTLENFYALTKPS